MICMPGNHKKSVVYIDGYNLYYGAVRGTAWKWLDIQAYFIRLRQDDDIQAIKYFTALVEGDKAARLRQETFLDALRTLPLVKVFPGRYKRKNVRCGTGCGYLGDRWFHIPEEKQTDVSIGVEMVDDAYQNVCERLIVVSGDSDLLPALRMVKRRFPNKTLHVYVPASDPRRGAAVEIRSAADYHRTLPLNLLQHCQLPDPVMAADGGAIAKPSSW